MISVKDYEFVLGIHDLAKSAGFVLEITNSPITYQNEFSLRPTHKAYIDDASIARFDDLYEVAKFIKTWKLSRFYADMERKSSGIGVKSK